MQVIYHYPVGQYYLLRPVRFNQCSEALCHIYVDDKLQDSQNQITIHPYSGEQYLLDGIERIGTSIGSKLTRVLTNNTHMKMEKIYERWKKQKSGRECYGTAEVTYSFDASSDFDTEVYGKHRKTLKASINDANRCYKKRPELSISFYAHAVLRDYYSDGTLIRTYDETVRIGTLHDGEYFDLCEQVDWL